MALSGLAAASIVFLIVYAIIWIVLTFLLVTKRESWKSRWALLYFHVVVRLAAQGVGIAFGIVGLDNLNLLVAFLVLGAEGYFTLVLVAYRFLVVWHQRNLRSGESFLEERKDGWPEWRKWAAIFAITNVRKDPLTVLHAALIVANALIITGGSKLTSAYSHGQFDESAINQAKTYRGIGQGIFLFANAALLAALLYTIRLSKRDLGRVHPTVWLLLLAWPFLIVRGIYGILQAVLAVGNFFDPNNYETVDGSTSFTPHFTAEETCMATLMEASAAIIFLATHWTSKQDVRQSSKAIELEAVDKEGAKA